MVAYSNKPGGRLKHKKSNGINSLPNLQVCDPHWNHWNEATRQISIYALLAIHQVKD